MGHTYCMETTAGNGTEEEKAGYNSFLHGSPASAIHERGGPWHLAANFLPDAFNPALDAQEREELERESTTTSLQQYVIL